MRSFNQVKLENPIAAAVFVYLRHSCNPEQMDDQGFTQLCSISRELGYTSQDILDAVHSFNGKRSRHQQITLDDDGRGMVILKANTCHSIAKVVGALEFYSPSRWEKGYIFLRRDSPYQIGDDIFPSGHRNDVVIRFPSFKPRGHCLVINLWKLSNYAPVYKFDSTGNRNDVVIKFNKYAPRGHYLIISLWKLAQTVPLFQNDSSGVFARGAIPANCITYVYPSVRQ